MDSAGSCFHVPQQSRRDKLRVPPACSEEPAFQVLPPPALANPPPPPPHNSNNLYDPSLLHSHSHSHFLPLGGSNYKQPPLPLLPDPPSSSVKDESAAGSNYVVAGGPFHGLLHLDSTRPPLQHHHQQVQDIPLLYANSSSSSSADFHHHSLGFTQVGVGVGVGDVPVTTFNGQGLLSLSLSNSAPHAHALELNLPRFDASTRMRTSPPVPLGPFTGYASILKGSRFLKPAQELLDQLCDVGRGLHHASSIESSPSSPPAILHDPRTTTTNKIRLISLLEEVYRRYKFYFQQMQSIMSSFESVAGLGNAAPYASFALNTMSRHFRFLKNAITNQLHSFASKPPGNEGFSKDESIVYGNSEQWVQCHSTSQSTGVFDHQPVWRPQRGLPERAVAVLRAWLFEHFLHPYPTDNDKQMLAKQTGLSRSQVSNWFINARVRLWKPMVEEIHMLETRQAQKSSSDAEDQNSSKPTNESQLSMNSTVSDKQAQTYSKHNLEDHSVKRSRNDELPSIAPDGGAQPVNLSSYDSLPCHENVDGGGNSIAAGGNSGVSLTLGLRQNNVAGLSELFPMNLARRFGVDPNNGSYMIDSFDGSNRQFGKSISGYMLHDFVG